MQEPLEFIALRSVKYNDRNNILAVYSRQHGRLSFLMPAGNGREATRRRALLMPLSICECRTDLKRGGEIHTMRDVSPLMPLHGIHSHPVKASVAMFIADVLSVTLRETQGDDALFAFIVDTVKHLNSCPASKVANFHIAFLRQLAIYLGIEPDFSSFRQGSYFDTLNGIFRLTTPSHHDYLSPAESAVAHTLGRMNYYNQHLYRFDRTARNTITDAILAYYTLHYTPIKNLSTLTVLRSL